MPSISTSMLAVAILMSVAFVSVPLAQEQPKPQDEASLPAEDADISSTDRPLTGKERLARKWMDEQRADDCKVPLDKRGPTPRPDCAVPPARQGQ